MAAAVECPICLRADPQILPPLSHLRDRCGPNQPLGHGIVSMSAVDTTLRGNAVGDNHYDGVDLFDGAVFDRS
jgi:hypothetical protein